MDTVGPTQTHCVDFHAMGVLEADVLETSECNQHTGEDC